MNTAPFEIIAAPFTLYLAPVATAFPVIDAVPAAAWIKVGTSGPLNYSEDGVMVSHPQSIEKWRSLGAAGARKAFRTEEDLIISLTLVDLTLEQYKVALNGNTVTDTPSGVGVAGHRAVNLARGLDVARYALLVRGISAYGDFTAQYEVPIVIQTGSQELPYTKSSPAGLALTFEALLDDTTGFGVLRMQDAVAG